MKSHVSSVAQVGQRSSEAVLNVGHLLIGFQQLFLESRDVANLRHLLQDGAEALQSLPDLCRVIQHHLKHKKDKMYVLLFFQPMHIFPTFTF